MKKRKKPKKGGTMNTICEIKENSMNEPKKDIGKRKDYYVYHLIDPKTNLPFYVGKGRGDRMFHHEKYVKNNRIVDNKFLFYKILNIFIVNFCKDLKFDNINSLLSGFNIRDVRLWTLQFLCNLHLSQPCFFASFTQSLNKIGIFLCSN